MAKAQLFQEMSRQVLIDTTIGMRMLLAEGMRAARWGRHHTRMLRPNLQEVDATDEMFEPEICEVGASHVDRRKIVVADVFIRPF
eukprot:Skav229546  [mRNA]  locus=scaffold568:240510:240970:- [translate_table: standard]